MTTSGCRASPGGRITLVTRFEPPGPGTRTTCSRSCAAAGQMIAKTSSRAARRLRCMDRVLAAAAPPRSSARARAGAHAAEDAGGLPLAQGDADVGTGGLARQLELVYLETADLVADAGGFLELEVGRGVTHALLELGDVATQIVAYQGDVARDAGVDGA